MHNEKALYVKHQAYEKTEQLRITPSPGVPISGDLIHKLDIVHPYLEHNSVAENRIIDSPDLINLNSDYSLPALVSSSKNSNQRCEATFDSSVNDKGRIQSGTAIDSVDSARSSDSEVVYWEIADIRATKQVDSECRSVENQLLGPAASAQECIGVLEFGTAERQKQADRKQVGMKTSYPELQIHFHVMTFFSVTPWIVSFAAIVLARHTTRSLPHQRLLQPEPHSFPFVFSAWRLHMIIRDCCVKLQDISEISYGCSSRCFICASTTIAKDKIYIYGKNSLNIAERIVNDKLVNGRPAWTPLVVSGSYAF